MKNHLIGILIGSLACVLNVLAIGNFSPAEKCGALQPVPAIVASATTRTAIATQTDLSAARKNQLLKAAYEDARRFWSTIGKDVYSGVGYVEIAIDDDSSSPSWKIRIKLLPNKNSAFEASPQVFYSESYPGNETVAWKVEEEADPQTEVSENARFVFKKAEPGFREIRPNVFLAE